MAFLERHRPTSFDDVVGNETIVRFLRSLKSAQHLIFEGPPGCGKTTCAHVLRRALRANALEVNASSDVSIAVMREGVMAFVERALDRKMMILDEADSMESHCQRALVDDVMRRVPCIVICNDVTRIEQCVRSRCLEITFERVDDASMTRAVQRVTRDIVFDDEHALPAIVAAAHGDVRQALAIVQKATVNSHIALVDTAYDDSAVLDERVCAMLYDARDFDDAHRQFAALLEYTLEDIVASARRVARNDFTLLPRIEALVKRDMLTPLQFAALLVH